MISKELLSVVLNKPLRNFNNYIKRNDLVYDRVFHEGCEDGHKKIINIYELAHKCKEWAFEQGYELYSVKNYSVRTSDAVSRIGMWLSIVMSNSKSSLEMKSKNIFADTEPEAIFKACQWILDNKDSK